jgi:hypothetical protein
LSDDRIVVYDPLARQQPVAGGPELQEFSEMNSARWSRRNFLKSMQAIA